MDLAKSLIAIQVIGLKHAKVEKNLAPANCSAPLLDPTFVSAENGLACLELDVFS